MIEVCAMGNKYGEILGWMSCEYVDEIPGNPYKRAPLTITHRSDRAKALKRLQKKRESNFIFYGQKMQHIIIHPKLDLVNVIFRPFLFTKLSLFTKSSLDKE